jgi:hypothetical protein
MNATDTEEPLYEMQEEGAVPSTMDAAPSRTMDDRPRKILFDMKVLHEMQNIDSSTSEIAHSEPVIPADGSSAAGLSSRPLNTRASTRASWISTVLASKGLSFFAATCTIFNMTGASLYVPRAFAQAGTLLTSIVLGVAILQAYISASFLLDASARAQALDLLMTDGSSMFRQPRRYSMKIRDRKYEVSRLTKIFLGKWGSMFFSLTTLSSVRSWARLPVQDTLDVVVFRIRA